MESIQTFENENLENEIIDTQMEDTTLAAFNANWIVEEYLNSKKK